jgi:polar amino acid transport system permease protein
MFENGLENLEPLLRGTLWTIALTVTSGVIGTFLGLILGLAETSPSRIARWISTTYVTIIRGVPLLILIFFIYFGIPLLVPGADLPGFLTGAIALTAFAAAYIAEIFRGSIEAIAKGQSEAADALGLGYVDKFRYVIMPQAVKIAVAPGITFIIGLVKDSSLISVIGFVELTRAGHIVSNLTFDPITTYLVAAAIYFVICYGISLAGRAYEKKLGTQTDIEHTDLATAIPPMKIRIGHSE